MAFERSYLFVPGDRPERFAKALDSGADRVILDLEDAVQPAAKVSAREAVLDWISKSGETGHADVLVRINGVDTPWHADDLAAFGVQSKSVIGLILPKTESVEAVSAVCSRLAGKPLIALIETVRGLLHLRELTACSGVARVAFGSVDFCADAGIEGEDEELHFVRSHLVLESRLAKLPPPIDGVTIVLDDEERIRRDVARARRFGFGAKLCIHPKQVGSVNTGFSPSADEVEWARRVVIASEGSGERGAIAVDGKLVDKPVLDRARRLLAQHAAISCSPSL
jgi:citrate lyase subunit beta/citryl-CoA lyase